MDILFIHNNFPGQFVHTAQAMAQRKGVRVFAVGGPTAKARPGVGLARYAIPAKPPRAGHPLAERFVTDLMRGELAAAAMQRLQKEVGCDPALVVGHSGWGETLFARDVFPNARQLVYSEFSTSSKARTSASTLNSGTPGCAPRSGSGRRTPAC